jgi:hypothetical protein
MYQKLITQEVAIVVAVENCDPAILNLSFLTQSGVIPKSWELARPSVLTSQSSQILFRNGIGLSAQSDRVAFVEVMGNRDVSEMQVAEVADRYVEKLPYGVYTGVGINFRGYVSCEGNPNAATQYLSHTLLSPGSWQEFGEAPIKAAINLTYALEQGQLNLSVNEATLQFSEHSSFPAILFSSNFNHDLEMDGETSQLDQLSSFIKSWQSHWEICRNLINHHFLSHVVDQTSIIPEVSGAIANALL